ncbi:MAG TPA: L-glutamate gamma-semialdehyde dehydrogenase [Gemmataceae bacterium]|nr:L-glutamate gamma-semialdehyde dehydrogenase [Gemmataceae bacterium]
MTPASDLERRTIAYGREIFARVDRQGPQAFTPAWVDQLLMDWTMSAEQLKVQLFRFIDALPRLHDPAAIAWHLREYLGEAGDAVPWWIRYGVRMLPSDGLGGRLLARAAKWNAEHLARRFIAGSNVEEAVRSVKRLRQKSLAFTVDLLGEATITEAEADAVQKQYLDLVAGLTREINELPEIPLIDRDHRGPIPRVNVSVKLSALYSQFDPIDPEGTSRVVRRRLRPILSAARQTRAFVNFDMEQYAFKDATLRIFREILDEPEYRDWPDVGIAIQAYLKDTEQDLRDLRDWAKARGTPVGIRLVKGAYWDYETVIAAQNDWPVPVWTEKWQSDACYERSARLLMENYEWLRPAFGTHNVRSMAAALALADEYRVPPDAYEFQMLYGMGDEFKDVLVGLGRRVRIYTPYGQLLPGMAYLVRRLLENTSNESFLRATESGDITEEALLMNPTLKASTHTHSVAPVPAAPPLSSEPQANRYHNEPPSDFSREDARAKMQHALDRVKIEFGKTYPLVINGQPITTTETVASLNPSHSSQVVGNVSKATVAHAEQAIRAAKDAFPGWRDTDPVVRAEHLRKVARRFRERRFELAAWIVHETGKPWRESDADVAEAIDFCEYYAAEMVRLANPLRRDVPGEENEYFYEPRGVTVVIAPWNFPLAILTGMTSAALVTGNTIILKPAEPSAVIGAKLMEVLQEAGIPKGVANYVPGVGREIGPMFVGHPDVAMIAFTGSLGVGLWINETAAKTPPGQDHVKRVIAEMGGKNAVVVDADADLDEAVKGVADSAFGYQGQKCSAGSRAIVLEPVYDAFLARLIETTKSLVVGPAESPGSTIGPVIDADAQSRIEKMIETGKREARLAYAGDLGALENEGFYVAPHIFAEVSPNAVIAQEEIFGPVLTVIKARDLDEALEIANGTKYALTGAFFSRSPRNIAEVRRRFRVGNLYINRKSTGALVDRQPFGGFKLSGIGSKAGGPDYLLQFLLPRVITENTMRRGFAPGAEVVSSGRGEE